jgi:hypothetical protein
MVIAQDFGNYCAQIELEKRAEKNAAVFCLECKWVLFGMQLYFVWNAGGFYLGCS